jgi:large subunit ribosomal protein L13
MEKDSTTIIKKAIRGMLPINRLRDGRLNRLKIYAGAEHEHEAQKPSVISLLDKKEKKS